MRKKVLHASLAVFFCSVFSLSFGQNVILNYLNASPDGADVLVTWEVQALNGVSNFKVYRKIDDETSYTFLDDMGPDGGLDYQFLDHTIFKDAPKSISYKIVVYQGNEGAAFYTSIVHNPTSVQRTWGSIKAMFR